MFQLAEVIDETDAAFDDEAVLAGRGKRLLVAFVDSGSTGFAPGSASSQLSISLVVIWRSRDSAAFASRGAASDESSKLTQRVAARRIDARG